MRGIIAATLLCVVLGPSPSSAQRAPAATGDLLIVTQAEDMAEGEDAAVRLDSASVLVETGAGVARTSIEMLFRNPGQRVLEGNLQFPLQPGQEVVGFALDIDGRLRDAVPVAKVRGRQVFEDIERRNVDPGLLEQTEGEFFRLRIYPFAPQGTRRVRITLLEPLRYDDNGASVTLPLQFARGLAALDVAVRSATPPQLAGTMAPLRTAAGSDGLHRVRLARESFRPERGITLRLPPTHTPAVQRQVYGDDTYFLADIPVGDAAVARGLPSHVGLLWDSSMSGAERAHDLEFALLDAYFRAAGEVEVQLVRLRDVPEPPEAFRVSGGDWRALRRALESTVYDGATAAAGWTPDPRVGEYLLFGDGLFNYGAGALPSFAAGQRLFAVKAGSAGASDRLAALADARGGRLIELRDRSGLPAATAALLQDAPRLIGLEAVGATDVVTATRVADRDRLRIAGRMTEARARLTLRIAQGARVVPLDVEIADPAAGELAALQWARFSIAALEADPESNRGAIEAIGREFGIVTPQTSLIVLEQAADYVLYDLPAPAELRAEVARLQAEGALERKRSRQEHLDAVAEAWAERVAWWTQPFPKGRPRRVAETDDPLVRDAPAPESRMRVMAAPPAPVESAAAASESTSLDRIEVTGSRIDEAELEGIAGTASIRLQPWQSDSPYARRLRNARAEDVYALYLDERLRRPQGTAFFLDVADILLQKRQPALALRVLSNLAEMELDNRHVLRVLGYRLIEAERADLAVPVFERVLAMGEEEPQSYRDLAHALAAIGERQRAIELLYEVVRGEWDDRFAEIEQIALAELNALVATAPRPLDTRAVDRRLLRSLPLELRAVLSWDSNNSDMDLWVTDPNGEKAYYGNPLTWQGGRMSEDFTGGYGPEEFALRDAKPGTYRVEANFYGDHQQLVTGATTLQLWLSTGFGTARQQEQRVTLRLKEATDTVLVGEFEVK